MICYRTYTHTLTLFLLIVLMWVATSSYSYAAEENFEAEHKVVIQVSSADPVTHRLAIANAVNLQKRYGIDHVAVEVVAYGPGLAILTASSKQAQRVHSLASQNVRFSACSNTIRHISEKKGKAPVLTEGVTVVPAGVARIIELQEKGYSYVRP